MPVKPYRPCNHVGCPELIRDGRYCDRHQKEKQQQQDQRRGSAASRGYDSRWQKARKRFLIQHPLCVECQRQGFIVAASVVDHVAPHKGNYKLFWDESNWQPLCKRCHDIKTATEDGGFGNG